MSTLIGLAGYAGAGKSTIARELIFALRYEDSSAAIASFAAGIKVMTGALIDYLECAARDKDSEVIYGVTRRKLEQVIGTECGRAIRSDFWVTVLRERVETSAYANVDFVIIDDVRFPEEVEMILRSGGMVIGVDTDDLFYPEGVYNHPSEQYDVLKSAYKFPTIYNNRLSPRPPAQEIISLMREAKML